MRWVGGSPMWWEPVFRVTKKVFPSEGFQIKPHL